MRDEHPRLFLCTEQALVYTARAPSFTRRAPSFTGKMPSFMVLEPCEINRISVNIDDRLFVLQGGIVPIQPFARRSSLAKIVPLISFPTQTA